MPTKIFSIVLLLFFFSVSSFGEVKIREDWAATPPEFPITQEHVVNKELTLKLHGDSKDKIKKSHHANKKNDPHYVWSGLTTSLWAVTLTLKDKVDASGKALSLKWRTKQAGGRTLYLLIQNQKGEWFIYNEGTGEAKDWNEATITLESSKWSAFDIKTLKKGEGVKEISLEGITAIGFTDLVPGGKSKACSRLDWIELTVK